jgi:hypothetical protein
MKNLFLILVTALTLSSCDKDNDNPPPTNLVDQLPPSTQTGADTAGCLVNGEAFVPYGNFQGLGNPDLFYKDGLNFRLFIGKKNESSNFLSVSSKFQKLEVGMTVPLKKDLHSNVITNAYGYFLDGTNSREFNTNETVAGELKITHHDFDHAILSGTFWFDAVNSKGVKVEVREGRFDVHY